MTLQKRFIYTLLLTLLPIAMSAQMRFGYYDHDVVLQSMTDYTEAKSAVEKLNKQYEDEMQRAAADLNSKYEDFLDGQKDFAPSILKKRQAELQDIYNKNIAFRKDAERLLAESEKAIYAPVLQRLNTIIRQVGQQYGYAFVIRHDADMMPFINEMIGEDITEELIELLKNY